MFFTRSTASVAVLLAGMVFVSAALAADTSTIEPVSRELVTSGDIGQVLFGLAIVVVAILLVAWLLRRVGGVVPNNGKLKVVAGMAVGQRERVMLIQLGDSKQVLLGVTAQRISRLAEFEEPVILPENSAEFASRLRGALSSDKGQK